MSEDAVEGETNDAPREAADLADYLDDEATVLPPFSDTELAVVRIRELFQAADGATFSFHFGDMGGKPYHAVSVYPDLGKSQDGSNISGDVLRQFIQDNLQVLRQDVRVCVGLWYDPELNKTFIDISAVITSRERAIRLAKRYNQISVYDLKFRREIETGGTGEPPTGMPEPTKRLPRLRRGRRD